ncbi:hypothetical protein PFISCL1PPCAC_16499, partial [Pristionchus fissidentatus]
LRDINFPNFPISINPTFETVYVCVNSLTGFIAISLNCFVIFLIGFKSKFLGRQYMHCLLVLKVFSLLYDINSSILFVPFILFPCMGAYSKGIDTLRHVSFRNLCLVQLLFVPSTSNDHALSPRSSLLVYSLMNVIMFINPIVFLFTSTDDGEKQRPIVERSPMFWLLETPSYKIYTDDNNPAVKYFHFPYTMITFVLCTLTTSFLTSHSIRVMKSRSDSISAATMALQERLIHSLSIQMNVQTVGVGTPVLFWLVCLIAGLIAPECTVAAFLLMLLTSSANSLYTI